MLDAIRRNVSLSWGIVTNKPGWLTDPLLVEVNLNGRARAVVSGDTLAAAQATSTCRCCTRLRHLGVNPHECVFVGDAERDFRPPKAAGMYSVIAGFGYIGDDDRADPLVSARLAGHAARPHHLARSAPREQAPVSECHLDRVVAAPGSLAVIELGIFAGTSLLRAARRAENLRAGTRGRHVIAIALPQRKKASSAPAPQNCWRRARRRCAPPSSPTRALALDARSETFLKLAREVSGSDQAAATASLGEREMAFEVLMEPLRRRSPQGRQAQASCANGASPPARSRGRSRASRLAGRAAARDAQSVTALRRPKCAAAGAR